MLGKPPEKLLKNRAVRLIGEFCLVLFVAFIVTTMISRSYSFWWIALFAAVIVSLPDAVALLRSSVRADSEKPHTP